VAAIYKAARMVGGDLFDFVQMDEHTFAVAVADVSGKGIPGSLVMSMVRTALQLEARDHRSAREILIRINDFTARHIKRGMFVTILLAVVDTATGRINFASAGHNPILHYDSHERKARFLNAPGMPVGIKAGNGDFAEAMKAAEVSLKENDFLLIYTDGVTEGRGVHKRAYGTQRIVELLKENGSSSAVEMARAIETDLVRFIGKEVQHDDITMVILKYNPLKGEDSEPADRESENMQPSSHSKPSIDSVTIRSNHTTDGLS
jgi:sigma-B regulation protein RsbU (phosphoserine phosphatase)